MITDQRRITNDEWLILADQWPLCFDLLSSDN